MHNLVQWRKKQLYMQLFRNIKLPTCRHETFLIFIFYKVFSSFLFFSLKIYRLCVTMQSLLAMRNPRADIRWNIKPWVNWVCFAVMSLHSHACHRLWIKSRQIPLLIHYKTLNQLHVQLIHTLIHKSTGNNICFFLPEIHSFLFSGNS